MVGSLSAIAFGARHDQLDAYLAAWVALLDESHREALGRQPLDAISGSIFLWRYQDM